MNIILNNSSMIPIYEQLVSQIKAGIISGSLKVGDPLPSVRALASDLRISALTVKKSYDFLEEEGYVSTVHGKGTYVSATNLQLAAELRQKSIEDSFAEAIEKARAFGLSSKEIMEIMDILLESEP